jgi:hypothetical protein
MNREVKGLRTAVQGKEEIENGKMTIEHGNAGLW